MDVNKLDPKAFVRLDTLVSSLRTGKILSSKELQEIELKINEHIGDKFLLDKFTRFWNINVTNSAYQAGQKDGKFIFISKPKPSASEAAARAAEAKRNGKDIQSYYQELKAAKDS